MMRHGNPSKLSRDEIAAIKDCAAQLKQAIDDLKIVEKSGLMLFDRFRLASDSVWAAHDRLFEMWRRFDYGGERKATVDAEIVDDPPDRLPAVRPVRLLPGA